MTEYYIPTRESEATFVEKRSEFIGHVWRVCTSTGSLSGLAGASALSCSCADAPNGASKPNRHKEVKIFFICNTVS